MPLEPLRTRLSGSDADAPAIRTGGGGWPHCLWVEGSSIRYARYYGKEWTFLGGVSLARESSSDVVIFPNSLDVDELGRPYAVIYESSWIKILWWDGSAWQTEGVTSVSGKELTGAACCWRSEPFISALYWTSSKSTLCMYRKTGGVWSFVQEDLGGQDQVPASLVSRNVDCYIYNFWKASKAGEGWIGHMMYHPTSDVWAGLIEKKVSFSMQDAEIVDLDFVTMDENLSSSSSS